MIDSDQKKRPNCDEILETKKERGLSRLDLILDSLIDSIMKLVSQIIQIIFETELLENCFIKRFIKVKFNI
jgi:predicted KAP-like P-loop ATPase